MTILRALLALPLLALPACYVDSDCVRTTTSAREASKVRLAGGSAVVTATLRANGDGLDGKELTFEILDDGASVYTAEARTGSDGTARYDLKRASADALLAIARADAFRASFDGDETYCSSSDQAGFHTVG